MYSGAPPVASYLGTLINVIYLYVDVSFLFPNQLCCVTFFKGLRFGGAYVLSRLRHVSLGGFDRLWVVFWEVLHSEQRPSDEVAGLNCLDLCRFDWVTAYRVRPLDCLLY